MKSLKGHLLIASATLLDPNFKQAVVLIVQHSAQGALGLVLNRPLELTIRQAAEQVLGTPCAADGPLHHGGPCESMLAVVHSVSSEDDDEQDDDEQQVLPNLFFTTDRPRIERLLQLPDLDDTNAKFFVGYAGWGPQQLEGEMETGSWLTAPARPTHIFSPPEPLWLRVTTEINLSKYIHPSRIPPDPRLN
jgi:putative transcriptional regulator